MAPDNNPRVLEAITPSRIGGAEVYVSELCSRLPSFGIEPVLFCPSGRTFIDYAAKSGHQVISWNTHGKIDPVTVLKLVKLIKKHNCTSIHTHLSTASLLGAFAAKFAGIKSIAHVHGMNSGFSFRFSDKILAVSNAVRAHLCAQGLEKKVHVVYNGVDTEYFQPLDKENSRSSIDIGPESKVFGVFGRLSSEKGQEIAIKAFAGIAKTYSDSILLVVGDGKNERMLKELAHSLGISENIRFVGFTRDIRSMIAACDAVVVPSLKEGFGLTAVNAMAMERPVIASRVGGLEEIVDQETGILVSPGDIISLEAAMQNVTTKSFPAQDMGKAGRNKVLQNFEINKQIGKVAEILLNV